MDGRRGFFLGMRPPDESLLVFSSMSLSIECGTVGVVSIIIVGSV